MTQSPAAHELIRSVRAFISETARPALTGHAAFHARVAENALAIVERELVKGADANARAVSRLQSLLKADAEDRRELDRKLCQEIRAGRLSVSNAELMKHLKASLIDQVQIDQPKYSGLKIATGS